MTPKHTSSIESDIHTLESLLTHLEDDKVDLNTATDQYAKALKTAKKVCDALTKTQGKLKILEAEKDQFLSENKARGPA